MNRITAIGLASLVAYGVLLVTKWGGTGVPAADVSASKAASVPATAPTLGESQVIARQASTPVSYASRATQPARQSGVAAEFRATRDLKGFADALLARKESLSREERYYLAKALETCLFATSMNDDLAASSDTRRRQFLSGLPANDPMAAKRIAAYDAADDTARCQRFQGVRIVASEIEELYRQAAQAGDPRSQARILVAELNKNLAGKDAIEQRAVATDDFQRIIRLLETRDADAMVTVAQFLAQNRLIGELRIGPNGEVPEPASLVGAFSLVACDFQPACPAYDREALQACAYAGFCSAGSYEELYSNFLASPWTYSMAMRYRSIIHTAIDNQNWGLLGLQKLVGAKLRSTP